MLQGHGVRMREVVVVAETARTAERVDDCWVRRYRCTACRAVTTVVPRGVFRRFLYSLGAIVTALFLVALLPVGEGLSHEAAYARQGMFERTGWRDGGPYRWRSLERWSARALGWWPAEAAFGVGALLVTLVERAGAGGRVAALEAAVRAHVGWGSAM